MQVTVSVPDGTTGNYIFINNPDNHYDWGKEATLTGQPCADGQYDERLLAPVTGDTTLLHCYEDVQLMEVVPRHQHRL